MPDIKKGENFMKAVVKASLHALFAIGIKSPEMIDRFVIAFTENFEKQMELMRSELKVTEVTEGTELKVETPVEKKPKKKGKKK